MNNKVISATKWSGITEIVAKLVNPITTMVLARVLTPDSFGVVATISVVISFAEIFTDTGFQKYIIQHEFKDINEQLENVNVAFWSNCFVSIFLWIIIALLRNQIAEIVGYPELGAVLLVSCVSIPLSGFSSIQIALLKRNFDFKTLFYVRIASLFLPLLITIPVALICRNFWALIIGTIANNILTAIILVSKSVWRPKLYYSFIQLKEMLGYTIWTMMETILVWLTLYLDLLIVGKVLDSYYLGIYRTSIALVNQITNIVVGILVPVLFSALSRFQHDKQGFIRTFLVFQKNAALIVFPLSVGIFIYRALLTDVMLGTNWYEAIPFIGIWGLMNAPVLIISNMASEAYRAMGKPHIASLSQILHLAAVIPVVIISIKFGFETLYYSRSFIRLEGVLVNLIILKLLVDIPIVKMLKNIFPIVGASVIMGICAYWFVGISTNKVWLFASIFLCSIIYMCVLCIFPTERKVLIKLKRIIY